MTVQIILFFIYVGSLEFCLYHTFFQCQPSTIYTRIVACPVLQPIGGQIMVSWSIMWVELCLGNRMIDGASIVIIPNINICFTWFRWIDMNYCISFEVTLILFVKKKVFSLSNILTCYFCKRIFHFLDNFWPCITSYNVVLYIIVSIDGEL